MSFDVFFQRFSDGDAGDGGNEEARAVLAPYIVAEDGGHVRLVVDGRETDIYGLDDDSAFMATHIEGDVVWDVLVRAAQAADYVILPVGCATCIVDSKQEAHLPEPLKDRVALVPDGPALLAVIRAG